MWQNTEILHTSSLWESKNICDLLLNDRHIPVPQNRWRREGTDEGQMTIFL